MNIKSIYADEVVRYSEGNIPSLLLRLKEGLVSREDLKLIVERRYQAAHFFEEWLRFIIQVVSKSAFEKTEKDMLSHAAKQNLEEELGEIADYGGPHKNGRAVQLTGLNIDPITWAAQLGTYNNLGELHPAAKQLVEDMKRIVSIGAIEAIAALWYYENRISLDGTSGDYYILLHAIENAYPEFKKDSYIEGDVLYHIASHAGHDEFHADLAEKALNEVNCDNKDERIVSACLQARVAIDHFWNHVLD